MNQTIVSRYNVTITGKGTQPILFAHGFGCDQGMWRYVAPAFEEQYKVIRFDYIGHGKATRDAYNRERYASLHGYAQDVLDICHGLELKNVVFVGHSVSSMIGLLACIQEPALFTRLVMVGPSPRYITRKAILVALNGKILRNSSIRWIVIFLVGRLQWGPLSWAMGIGLN